MVAEVKTVKMLRMISQKGEEQERGDQQEGDAEQGDDQHGQVGQAWAGRPGGHGQVGMDR